MARYGADDTILAWELFNELDLAVPWSERALRWVAAAAAFLKQQDVDHRLVTSSWYGHAWDELASLPVIDVVQIHRYVLEWIDTETGEGRTRGRVAFIPPPPDKLMGCLGAWEKFLHDDALPPLVHAALAHSQFEAIHRSGKTTFQAAPN